MKVILPSPLHSYTGDKVEVEALGATLDEVLRDLDARYPGMRFRIIDERGAVRPHLRIFRNRRDMLRSLSAPLRPKDEVLVVALLSGG
jgi:molybdopterin converting factor small subunit